MNRQANPAVVGGFVIGAIVLIVVGVLTFGSGHLLRERLEVVAYFAGNVRGLQEGSAVELQGVKVGTVKGISLTFDADRQEMLILVLMELDPRNLTVIDVIGGAEVADGVSREQLLDRLVEKGLRARLDLKSFVTGQLTVTFELRPDTPIVRLGAKPGLFEIPTVPSTMDRVAQVLQDLPLQDMTQTFIRALDSVEKLASSRALEKAVQDVALAAEGARRLVDALESHTGPLAENATITLNQARESVVALYQRLDVTLAAFDELVRTTRAGVDDLSRSAQGTFSELTRTGRSLDAQLKPVADSAGVALNEARGALRNLKGLLAEDSRTRHNLNLALEELAAAARSLRVMADYLKQNPDALLKGKRY